MESDGCYAAAAHAKSLGIRRVYVLIIKILSFVALIGSVAWFVYDPDFEPAIAIVTSLSALIATWVASKREQRSASQTQVVGENSVGIQSGGNVTAGDISIKRNSGDAE